MPDNPRLLQWRSLPMELRLKKQWLVASPNKNPLFLIGDQFYNASVSKHASSQWMSFEDATAAAIAFSLQIGFVIAEGDGIACIDLDVKPNTTKETLDLYQEIVQRFDSYTERSIGGNGIHIWCKGDIGLGRRRDGVEIYSQNRFMICTGNVLHLKEHLEPRQDLLTNMVSQMPMSADYNEIILEELPQVETDEEVGRKLWEIESARMLWQGQWQELDHPSQSEGDLDLMVHLVRFSPSNEQCYRLFRQSNLGKRTKANRKDYVDRTMRHARFIRQQELIDIEIGRKSAEAIAAKYDAEQATLKNTQLSQSSGSAVLNQAFELDPYEDYDQEPELKLSFDYELALEQKWESESQLELDLKEYQYEFPSGGLGYLARHFYKGSYHPNIQFSLMMAFTVMSALCGRAWNTSTNSGLNTYNLVIAPSGMGKEDLSKGLTRLIEACKIKYPPFENFFHFGRFTAGTSLAKHFSPLNIKRPPGMSFAQIATEFGDMISRFANGRDENMQGLMMTMLDFYGKASPGSKSSAISYSDMTKNVVSLDSPAYSILGETTPEVYEKMSDLLIDNGFLSRFNTVEYQGERLERIENPDFSIDPNIIEFLIQLAKIAEEIYRTNKKPIVARLSPEAKKRFDMFNKFCNKRYNMSLKAKSSDIEHFMWSRSPNRVNVFATLAAILDSSPLDGATIIPPTVTEEHWSYAEEIVMNDINNFKMKQQAGDLGTGDAICVKKLEMILDEYFHTPISSSYFVSAELQASNKIPYRYLRARALRLNCFKINKQFEERKLEDAIQTLINVGRLKLIKDPTQIPSNERGKIYWVYTR
jgi:hypothetical protein